MSASESSWHVIVPEALRCSLEASFLAGPIVDDEGRRYLTEARVGVEGGLVMDVFANEHPPPHFRVSFQGETANFRIDDGEKLNGGLTRYSRNIRRWYDENQDALIEAWNAHRPTDCPVGPVKT